MLYTETHLCRIFVSAVFMAATSASAFGVTLECNLPAKSFPDGTFFGGMNEIYNVTKENGWEINADFYRRAEKVKDGLAIYTISRYTGHFNLTLHGEVYSVQGSCKVFSENDRKF